MELHCVRTYCEGRGPQLSPEGERTAMTPHKFTRRSVAITRVYSRLPLRSDRIYMEHKDFMLLNYASYGALRRPTAGHVAYEGCNVRSRTGGK